MSLQFHETVMGRDFLDRTMPRIADALDRIAAATERLSADTEQIDQLRRENAELRRVVVRCSQWANTLKDISANPDEPFAADTAAASLGKERP